MREGEIKLQALISQRYYREGTRMTLDWWRGSLVFKETCFSENRLRALARMNTPKTLSLGGHTREKAHHDGAPERLRRSQMAWRP